MLRRRALFLDRDGVINVDHGWVGTRDRFEWTPGAREAIRSATEAGWHVFVVTNQSGVARGHYDEAAVVALHAWMIDEVRRAGGTIDDIRYCPFHRGCGRPRLSSRQRLAQAGPGMLLDLMRAWELGSGAVPAGRRPGERHGGRGSGRHRRPANSKAAISPPSCARSCKPDASPSAVTGTLRANIGDQDSRANPGPRIY